MSRKRAGRLSREVVMSAVDDISSEATRAGCSKCGAVTVVVQTRSIEFADASMVIVVMHRCDPCGETHVSFAATEGIAERERPRIAADFARGSDDLRLNG
jgi:RNase P subunit RPR2